MNKQHKNHSLRYANYFSIRKLTVGVASITLGTAIFLGTNHEAQAAEDTTSQAITNSAASSGQNTNTAHPTGLLPQVQLIKVIKLNRKILLKLHLIHRAHQLLKNNSNNNASNTTQSLQTLAKMHKLNFTLLII